MDNRPIGMFDSGIGGLTVLKEYLKLMPNEKYIYYADTEHLPYGDKTKEQIISYAEKIVEYFISQNVKAISIACGTASSLAYQHLTKKYDVPIFDIISPIAQNISSKKIGVIATQGSISSNVWENTIHKYNPNSEVYSQACPKLVPLAEKNLSNSFRAKCAIREYLKPLKSNNIDSLILGCTHYPLFYDIIKRELPDNVEIYNIGTYSANVFKNYLVNNSLETSSNYPQEVCYVVSGDENKFYRKMKN